jgi:hypothetical protein
VSTNLHLPPDAKKPSPANRVKNSLTRNRAIALIVVLVLLLAASTFGILFAASHRNTTNSNATGAAPIVGHVYFLSSGQLYVNNNQGISDEVLIDLHNMPAPAAGKSYYGWLLGDASQSDVSWVPLGKLLMSAEANKVC